MAEATRVVATTVGPYAKWGMPLVEACARSGTDYCDLTGEVLFVRDSIRAWHATAVDSGARIVHACGFESIPSDLGVLVTADEAGGRRRGRAHPGQARGRVDARRVQRRHDRLLSQPGRRGSGRPGRARAASRPQRAEPSRRTRPRRTAARSRTAQPGRRRRWLPVRRNAQTGRWVGPFIMGGFNARIVRRSNTLLGGRTGPVSGTGRSSTTGPARSRRWLRSR